MDRIFLKLQPPIDHPDLVALVRSLKNLSVLSGNSCADTFETNSIVNDSIVK